jgi:hypothetical protein
MKFFRLDLLTLLISLFILNSCKNEGAIGLGLNSSGQLNGNLVDTSTITTNTVLEDSLQTGGFSTPISKNPFGYFNDPVFGITQSDLALDINLPTAGYTAPFGTVIVDSARLILSFADGFYGDSLTSSYRVNAYQLNEKFIDGFPYYNTKKWSYNSSNLLGSLTFNSRTHDSIKIFHIIAGAPDTLIKVAAQIRIPISTTFINNNIFGASTTTLTSNIAFQNAIKGLYVTIDKTKTTGPGGIFMVSPTNTLAVYYRAFTGSAIDTGSFYFAINNTAAAVQHTYSATIQTELANTSTSRPNIYVQGVAGLRAKIGFPALLANLRNSLLKKDSDIILNRAELVVTPAPGSDIPYVTIPKLSLYRFDLARQRVYVEDASPNDPRSGGAAVFGGYYTASTKSYHFIVTAYLQDLLLNRTIDYGTYLSAVDITGTTTVDIAPTPSVASRTVAGGGSNKTSPYRMKLNIIYSKIFKPH